MGTAKLQQHPTVEVSMVMQSVSIFVLLLVLCEPVKVTFL